MRILVVSHLYPAPGADRHLFVHDQCVALRRLGVELHVISPTPYTPLPLWVSPRLRRRGQRPRVAVRDGIVAEYPRFMQPPRRLWFEHLGDLAHASVRRLASLRDRPFDVIHAHQALPDGALAQRLSADLDLPYVVTVHGADVNSTLPGGGAAARRTIAVLRAAAATVPVSEVLAQRLLRAAPLNNIVVVANGGPGEAPPATPAELAPGRRLVLAAGRLEPGKGFADVLAAVALLTPAEFADVDVAIVGDGSLAGQLRAQARELGIEQRVHFLGNRDRDELFGLMARADVFTLPSAPEGFGLVHLEAMAQATPVIACAGEGPSSYIVDGVSGKLVPAGDGVALSAALADLLGDSGQATAIGRAGQSVARIFTWERNARSMLKIYTAAAAGSSRSPSPMSLR